MVLQIILTGSLAFAGSLEEGRSALSENRLADALVAYKPVTLSDPQFADKLEDLVRYHLNRNEGLEAWRVIQIGRRVRVAKPGWLDLERLAVFRAGACPLALDGHDRARELLLNAGIYRFMNFEKTEGEREENVANLAPGLVPYLRDIPSTTLLRQQGCRVAKQLVRDKRSLRKAELKEILNYLNLGAKEKSNVADVLLSLRALELASDEPKLAGRIRDSLPKPSDLPWSELPDSERQWLFVHSFGGKKLDEIALERRDEAQSIALANLRAEDATPYWLAGVDLESLKPRERAELLSRVEKKGGSYAGRAWILFELARTRSQLGEMNEALTLLRRMLVENEETPDEKIEQASVNLAAQIFSEHRLDQKVMGALDAALPSRLWRSLLTQAIMRAALGGRASELAALEKIASRRNSRLDVELLRPLAKRNLQKFKFEVQYVTIDFARFFAAYLLEFPKTTPLVPYANAVAERLRRMAGSEDERKDLIQILSTSESDWVKGAIAVRQGVVKVGVARWPQTPLRPANFLLNPPETLDRRELFYVPDLKTERGWKLSTLKR